MNMFYCKAISTITLAGVLMTYGAAQTSQGEPTFGRGNLEQLRARHAGKLTLVLQQLNLSDSQKKSIKQVVNDGRRNIMKVRSSSLSQEQKTEEIRGIMKQVRDGVLNLLTAEQKEKLKTLMKEHDKKEEVRP